MREKTKTNVGENKKKTRGEATVFFPYILEYFLIAHSSSMLNEKTV